MPDHQAPTALNFELPPVLRLRLTFEAETPIVPPVSVGAMWRSVFGRALKTMGSDLYDSCFAPRGGLNLPGKGGDLPPGYTLDAMHHPDIVVVPGQQCSVDVTLIAGHALHAEEVIEAFAMAGQSGLGKGHDHGLGIVRLIGVQAMEMGPQGWIPSEIQAPSVPTVPPCPHRALIVLKSPLQVLRQKQIVGANALHPVLILGAAARRVSLLGQIYCEAPEAGRKLPKIEAEFTQVWLVNQHRWSGDQCKEIDTTGVMGSIMVPMAVARDHWPALWWAQWVGLGQKTSAGLGAVRVLGFAR